MRLAKLEINKLCVFLPEDVYAKGASAFNYL